MSEMPRLTRSELLRGRVKPDPIEDIGHLFEARADVGKEIKLLRKASEVTLAELSLATGLSKGYLSQIERGISSPSVKALHTISRALGVNISWFFRPPQDEDNELNDIIVRRDKRRTLKFEAGITDELLSPNLGRNIELLRCTFPPGTSSGKEPYEHKGEETGIVIEGTLTLWLAEKRIVLEAGDSFAFESDIPHRYANEGSVSAVVIWAVSPPSY